MPRSIMPGFPFLSDTRFLKADAALPEHRYVVAGLPWDGSVTNRPGARFGPRAIRQASHMLCDATHPMFDVSPLGVLGDVGDVTLPHAGHTAMQAAVQGVAADLLARHHMVWLGGDHSVTLPILRALRRQHGQALALLHFDAHCDTWADHFGEPSGHGTWVREAALEGLIDPARTVQIGIRSSAEREAREFIPARGGRVFTARDLRGLESPAALAPVVAEIRRRLGGEIAGGKKGGGAGDGLANSHALSTHRAHAADPADPNHPAHPARRPVYLSLDIDVLDPAFAPGTGTPEPGGLTTAQVLTLLEDLADLPFVGMDCVEVAPAYDHAELTTSAAAHFGWTYLCGRIAAEANTAHAPATPTT
jgi:agmatinase